MILSQAIREFAASLEFKDLPRASLPPSSEAIPKFDLFTSYFGGAEALNQITVDRLHEFLSRWLVEHWDANAGQLDALLQLLERFFGWVQSRGCTDFARQISILQELRPKIIRAIELGRALSESVRVHRGAFGFPEFLTSFEEGGRSEYDIDEPGERRAIEGFFRITRVEGTMAEAEELLSAEEVGPINFPHDVSQLLERGYVVNLELIRVEEHWEIFESGFAYPPEFDACPPSRSGS